jgi:hypothetical protein
MDFQMAKWLKRSDLRVSLECVPRSSMADGLSGGKIERYWFREIGVKKPAILQFVC